MNNTRHNRLQEFKVRASLLLKNFNSTDTAASEKAATRFLRLPFLKYSTTESLLNDRGFFRLKHAQQVLAIENGHKTWDAFRRQIIQEDCLFHKHSASYLNIWFNNYEEAKEYHTIHGGYLLQFRKDFAVCTHDYIHAIGLSAFEKEWAAMGYDWVKPACTQSWETIFIHVKQQYLAPEKKETIPAKAKGNRPQWLNNHH